jgi:hypothetical protein
MHAARFVAVLIALLMMIPGSAQADEPSPKKLEVGGAGVFTYARMDGERELAGGGILRVGMRLASLALAGEADVERGKNWGVDTTRVGLRGTAAWVYGPLRLGGGLGVAVRDVVYVDYDFIDSKKTAVLSPLLEVSLDFVRTDHFAAFVAARARLDIAPVGIVGAQLIPAGQAVLAFRIMP